MKCWKCEQEIADGVSTCVYCGVSPSRPAPTTEAGCAMRMLYDRYGAQEVLTNSAYLVNGLGDLTDESKKLRNQLKMSMDAGIGRVYFEQLSIGTPNSDFDQRVKVLLTEDAGLSDKATVDLMGYFDEMIGWRTITQSQSQSQPQLQSQPQDVEKKIPDSDEIDRSGFYESPEQEIDRNKSSKTTKPKVKTKPATRKGLYPYEIVLIVCIVAQLWLSNMINTSFSISSMFIEYLVYAILFIPLVVSFYQRKDRLRCGFTWGGLLAILLMFILGAFICRMAEFVLWDIENFALYGYSDFFLELTMLVSLVLMFVQMIRHRILEMKNAKK